MIAKTLLPILFFTTGAVLAAPSPAPVYCRRDPNNPRGCVIFEIQPSVAVIHDTHWSGQNVCNPNKCNVYKSAANNGHDLTTMLTFTYPAGVAGRQCWLEFDVPAAATVTGSAKVDVFRQWQPVNTCPSQGNNRDVQLGRMNVPAGGGRATWEATYNEHLTAPGPCPAPGTVEGIELVGVYDEDNVVWKQDPGVGVKIVYS